jgi:hypothetical protein
MCPHSTVYVSAGAEYVVEQNWVSAAGQVLSLLALLVQKHKYWQVRRCMPLSVLWERNLRSLHLYWVYLLYSYSSTNTDKWGALCLCQFCGSAISAACICTQFTCFTSAAVHISWRFTSVSLWELNHLRTLNLDHNQVSIWVTSAAVCVLLH